MRFTKRISTKNAHRTRLFCELLEERETPAAFTVNSVGDGPDADPDDNAALDVNGKTTLRAAIEEGNRRTGDHTINFSGTVFSAPNTYQILILATQLPELTANFAITGPTGATISIEPLYQAVDGVAEDYRIMSVDTSSTSTIKNLKFADALTKIQSGGAIYNKGDLTVENCSFIHCQAVSGGGIANTKILTLKTSTFDGNKAPMSDGGAMHCAANPNCVTTVTSTVLSNNQASKGGAIAALGGARLSVTASQMYTNNGIEGGAIYTSGATVTMSSTVLRDCPISPRITQNPAGFRGI
jgi:predicted outer membrane repeat protein